MKSGSFLLFAPRRMSADRLRAIAATAGFARVRDEAARRDFFAVVFLAFAPRDPDGDFVFAAAARNSALKSRCVWLRGAFDCAPDFSPLLPPDLRLLCHTRFLPLPAA